MRKAAISVSVLTLIATLLVPMQANAATAKAGAKCTKLKATQIVGAKKFTCIKSGSKLVWNKGVKIPKTATPKPPATTTPTPPATTPTPPATSTPTPPVVVVKKAQEIDFPALADVALLDKKFGLTKAITTGGLEVTISASGACSYDVASSSVALNSVGKCSITASQAGDANYLPAPSITRTFEILKSEQKIDSTPIEDAYFLDEQLLLNEAVTTGGLKVTYSASGTCSYDAVSNSVLYKSAGKCSVTASQAGDAYYLPATPVTLTFTINKSPQVIEVEEFEDQDLAETQGFDLTFTSNSDAPDVVIASATVDICEVNGYSITFLSEGDCKLTFTRAGNANFEAAPNVARTIRIVSSLATNSEENPADFGTEVIKQGISVTVDAINEEVSEAICEADSSNEACIDEDGTGVLDAESESRYVEVVLTITNDSDSTWVADQLTLMFGDESFDFTSVYEIDSIEELELEAGESITGSYFVLLPDELDSAEALVIYGNTEEEVSFFFKANL
jgi:hypothetical protein